MAIHSYGRSVLPHTFQDLAVESRNTTEEALSATVAFTVDNRYLFYIKMTWFELYNE